MSDESPAVNIGTAQSRTLSGSYRPIADSPTRTAVSSSIAITGGSTVLVVETTDRALASTQTARIP